MLICYLSTTSDVKIALVISQVGRDGQRGEGGGGEPQSNNGRVATADILNEFWLIRILRESMFFQVQTLILTSFMSLFLLSQYLRNAFCTPHPVIHFLPLDYS